MKSKKDVYELNAPYVLTNFLNTYLSGNDKMFITNTNHALCKDGNEYFNDYKGFTLHLDRASFEESMLSENYKSYIDDCWGFPTIQGYFVDFVSKFTYL